MSRNPKRPGHQDPLDRPPMAAEKTAAKSTKTTDETRLDPYTHPSLPLSIIHLILTQLVYVVGFAFPFTAGIYFLLRYPHVLLPPVILYYTHIFIWRTERDGNGRRWLWFSKRFIMARIGRSYHDMKLLIDRESLGEGIDQAILSCHPHGVLSDFRVLMDGEVIQKFVNLRSVRVLGAGVIFLIPFIREMCLWTGCIDASRENAEAALGNGHSLLVVPGGEVEQIECVYGREIIYLKKRKGFIRLAVKHGLPVIPAYMFGSSDLYYTSSFLRNARLWLVKKLRVAIPIFVGRWWTLGPLNRRLTAVFGKPIHFEKNLEPTQAQIDAAHELYIQRLQELFDANKERSGYGDRTLEIL